MTTLDKAREAFDEMGKAAADPMWADHVELSKTALRRWTKAFRPLLSAVPAQAVRVKPLEWDDYAHPYMMSYAIVPALWIAYRIALRSDGTKALRLERLENHNDDLGVFPDTEAAKAAAQADYDARILSALAPSQPAAVGVTDEQIDIIVTEINRRLAMDDQAVVHRSDVRNALSVAALRSTP